MAAPHADLQQTLDGVLGFEYLEVSEEAARARFEVEARHRQPFGVVHGGVYAALSEGLASVATYLGVKDEGMIAMGMSNHSTFLRPVAAGRIEAAARRRHRGRTTWVWDVDFSDERGRLCATSRVTIAVRPGPS